MDSSDAGILKIYSKNKHQGLELLYERYKKYVYTIAYHYAGNREDALDLTQEVFVSIFKNLDGFKVEFSLLPWVKRITVNRCLNFLRDRKQSLSLDRTDEDGDSIRDHLSSSEDTESQVFYLDTKQSLEKAIRNLPPNERMAVILRHMKGMKYEEIAKIMNLPLGTVKTSLHRGRNNIKESLKKDGTLEG